MQGEDSARMSDDNKIIERLREVGISVDSIWDLVNTRGLPNREAILMLLDLLPKLSDQRTKEGVVRALSTRDARGTDAVAVLIKELQRLALSPEETESLGWAIGNAISVIGKLRDRSSYDDLVELLRDKRLGAARQMLADAIAKTRHPGAVEVLLGALDDEELTGHAIFALGQLRASESRSAIEPFLSHENAWFRKEARRALYKINKANP